MCPCADGDSWNKGADATAGASPHFHSAAQHGEPAILRPLSKRHGHQYEGKALTCMLACKLTAVEECHLQKKKTLAG